MQGIARLQAAAELMAGILQKRANAALDTTVSQNAAQSTKATAIDAAVNNPHTGKLVSNPPRYDVEDISQNQQTMNTEGMYPQQPVQQKMAGMPANKFIHPSWLKRRSWNLFDPDLIERSGVAKGLRPLLLPARWGQGNWKFAIRMAHKARQTPLNLLNNPRVKFSGTGAKGGLGAGDYFSISPRATRAIKARTAMGRGTITIPTVPGNFGDPGMVNYSDMRIKLGPKGEAYNTWRLKPNKPGVMSMAVPINERGTMGFDRDGSPIHLYSSAERARVFGHPNTQMVDLPGRQPYALKNVSIGPGENPWDPRWHRSSPMHPESIGDVVASPFTLNGGKIPGPSDVYAQDPGRSRWLRNLFDL